MNLDVLRRSLKAFIALHIRIDEWGLDFPEYIESPERPPTIAKDIPARNFNYSDIAPYQGNSEPVTCTVSIPFEILIRFDNLNQYDELPRGEAEALLSYLMALLQREATCIDGDIKEIRCSGNVNVAEQENNDWLLVIRLEPTVTFIATLDDLNPNSALFAPNGSALIPSPPPEYVERYFTGYWGSLQGNIQDQADLWSILAGKESFGAAANAIASHLDEPNPHPQYIDGAELNQAIADHLTAPDPHPQYTTSTEVADLINAGNFAPAVHQHPISNITGLQGELDSKEEVGTAVATLTTHVAAPNPHPQYIDATELGEAIATITPAYIGAEPSGTAASTIAAHTNALDPHPQYMTSAEVEALLGGSSFAPAIHQHEIAAVNGLQVALDGKEAAGTAAQAIAAHEAATDPHPQYTTAAEVSTAIANKIDNTDPRLTDSRSPSGPAGGVLAGTYPNPSFAVDMATQAELEQAVANIPPAPVQSVFSRAGDVVAQSGDYNSDQVTEGSANLYLTAARSRSYLSATTPLSYDSSLGIFSLPAASASQDGYFSSADFTKLGGIQTGATANSADAFLLNRDNHTGNPVSVANGGTGASTAATARSNLGVPAKPATSTLNAIAKYADTAGNLANSGVTIDSSNNLVSPGTLNVAQINTSRTSTSAANTAHLFTYSDLNTSAGRNVLALGVNNRAGNWAGLSAAIDGSSDSLNLTTIRFYGVDRALAIWNSSAEVLRIISTNLVGIGTSTPGSRLQITGGLTVTTATTAAANPGNGSVAIDGTLKVGTSGTPLARLLSAIATLDFPSIAAGATSTLTITVTGAAVGDTVILGLPSSPQSGIVFLPPYVSATNTVSLPAYNPTGSAIDPPSASYRVAVLGF